MNSCSVIFVISFLGTCYAAPTCAPVTCLLHSQNGFASNSEGCAICECVKPNSESQSDSELKSECATIRCELTCDFGFLKGPDGCDECICATSRLESAEGKICPPVCAMYCEYGNKVDKSGCNTCQCNLPEATIPIELKQADDSLVRRDANEEDISSAELADEAATECWPSLCVIYCKFGLVFNVRSCRCSCDRDSIEQVPWKLFEPKSNCSTSENPCMISCENGYAKNRDGCYLCICKRRPDASYSSSLLEVVTAEIEPKTNCSTSGNPCMIFCEYGYVKNRYGCDLCICKRKANDDDSIEKIAEEDSITKFTDNILKSAGDFFKCMTETCPEGSICQEVGVSCENAKPGEQCKNIYYWKCVVNPQ